MEERQNSLTDTFDGLTKQNPVIRTYFYPKDRSSLKRYILIFSCVVGVLMFIGGPLMEVFLVQPIITLLLDQTLIVTPDTKCFDHRLSNQTCPDDVSVEYYFWNITNAQSWVDGSEPPAFEEIGPYAFKSREVRYNLSYSESWDSVEYTYHQWAEFDEKSSCPACSLNDTFVSVNRAYLQFLSASASLPVDSESSVIFQLLPSSMSLSFDIISSYIGAMYGASSSEALYNQSVAQWSECQPVQALGPILNLTSPFIKDIPVPIQPRYNPEFCHYIVDVFQSTYGIQISPSDFGLYGVGLSQEQSMAFLELAIGTSNATYQDAFSQQFLYLLLTNQQSTVVAYLTSLSIPQASDLATIDGVTWALMQGYVYKIMSDGGSVLFESFLVTSGSGMVVEKPLQEWLYGYEDALLLTAAKTLPSYTLRPWEYTPSLALTFPDALYPASYLSKETGTNLTFNDLSWRQTDIGRFMPLIQQKKLFTGKRRLTSSQDIQEYRGLPFRNETWGILNMTGQNEGIQLGSSAWQSSEFVTFDSALSRPILTTYSGKDIKVKNVDSMLFTMANSSVMACNWTAYQEWAEDSGFNPFTYLSTMGNLSASEYYEYMRNDSMLSEYLQSSYLGQNFSVPFGKVDTARDRCMVPDQADAVWDVSRTFACPSFYTLPRYLKAGDFIKLTTGTLEWNATEEEHSYGLAVEPMTGISVKGHKTYQLNHLVSRTQVMYPSIWVLNGSSVEIGYPQDFVTVPVFWVRMSWEPKTADAYLLRAMKTMISYMYTILVIFWPSIGFATAISSFLVLLMGKEGKERAKLIKVYQKSRAKPVVFRSGKFCASPTPGSAFAIHVDAGGLADQNQTSIIQAVSEAVGIEDASDEEEFVSSACLTVVEPPHSAPSSSSSV